MAITQFQRAIDYFIANRKLSELFLGMRVYRGSDMGADQFFSMTKLRFPPKQLRLPKNNAREENKIHYKISSLGDESIRNKIKQI
jgi:hypothetical protein